MSEEDKSYGDRIKEEITKEKNVTIPITFPRKSYKRFRRWAHEHASGCYWLAIDKLVDADEKKLDLSYEFRNLADRDEAILNEVTRLQEEVNNLKEKKSKSEPTRRTFGKKESEEDDE